MKTKVFMYCRKSSESEDRQILSIDSQVNELKVIAKRLNLEIVEILKESMSSKAPGRPIFSNMVERLLNCEAEGILSWKLDRLARNPIDGGSIIWAIKNNGISIFTPSQTYSKEQDNTLLMYVEFGMAQKFIDDLGKSAKRGMNTKAEMGWWPQKAPLGYMNTPNSRKGLKTIEKDPERFEIAKRCFKEVINGRNAMAVYEQAIAEWNLTSNVANKAISISTFYKMLNNPFYYGQFCWNDKWIQGKHEPMITQEEFDVVQRMLGNKGKPVQRAHTFELTGLFRCTQCGCALTATKKVKFYPKTRRQVEYIYYHCGKRNRKIKCFQKPITVKQLNNSIVEQLLKAQPPQEFIDWAKKWVGFMHKNESSFQEFALKNQHVELEKIEAKLNKLLDLFINESIREDEYKLKKSEIELNKLSIQRKIDSIDDDLDNWRTKVEDSLDFARNMAYRFEHGTREEKHQILIKVSSDLLYETKNPLIQLKKLFLPLKKLNENNFEENELVQTSKYADVFALYPDLIPTHSTWLPD